jgi:hypothetical protein
VIPAVGDGAGELYLEGWREQDHLPVLSDVPEGCRDDLWVVLQHADPGVAVTAKHATDLSGHVVVVYAPAGTSGSARRIGSADPASAALFGQQSVEVLYCQAVTV